MSDESTNAVYAASPRPRRPGPEAIARAFFQRGGQALQEIGGMLRYLLVPALDASSLEWMSGRGNWGATPIPTWTQALPLLPFGVVTDSGPGTTSLTVLGIYPFVPAHWRGRRIHILPKMVVARVLRIPVDWPATPFLQQRNLPIPLAIATGRGPYRADGNNDPAGVATAAALALALVLDPERQWERFMACGSSYALDVSGPNGASGTPLPLVEAEGSSAAGWAAAAGHSPENGRPRTP
jgi:hypothetical protein